MYAKAGYALNNLVILCDVHVGSLGKTDVLISQVSGGQRVVLMLDVKKSVHCFIIVTELVVGE